MSDASLSESTVETAALAWLEGCGWAVANGPDIAPDTAERGARRLRPGRAGAAPADPLARLNPDLPADALNDAFAS